MFAFLTNALKRRVMRDLRHFINNHPEYKDDLKIIPQFPQKDRPDMFIRVQGSNATLQRLDPSNHMGMVISHVQLLRLEQKPGWSVEWVREDKTNEGSLAAAGIYYLDFTADNEFMIDPLIEHTETLYDNYVTGESDADFQLSNIPVRGRVDMTRISGEDRIYMTEDEHFTLNRTTGEGTIVEEIGVQGWSIEIKYLAPGTSTGPFEFEPNSSLHEPLSGVVLAFGRRATQGDKMAVRIFEDREPTALAAGGKWQLGLTLEVWTKDPDTTQTLADFITMLFWGPLFHAYANEGIALVELNIGGESNEMYDENTDQVWFMQELSLSVMCDWEIHIPVSPAISGIRGVTHDTEDSLPTIVPQEDLTSVTPRIVSHSADLERIV